MILITGATGLLGQHLLETLSANTKVKATCRKLPTQFYTKINTQNVEWIVCDITDITSLEKAFQGVTQVYHCAAMVSYDPRKKEEMMDVNVEGTTHVVNLCLDHKIEKLVYVSSIATLGHRSADQLVTEKDDWEESKENSNYAMTKQAAEMEVWRGIAEGLNAVIVNPGIILGEGDDTKSSTNLFKVVREEFAYYTIGITSWVDVKDVVAIMIQLMNSPIDNDRFIVSAGNYSFLEIFTMMAKVMNKRPPYKLATPLMTEIVWRLSYLKSILTGKVATITKETARGAQKIKHFDNTKLINLISYTYTPIEEVIQRVSLSYLMGISKNL